MATVARLGQASTFYRITVADWLNEYLFAALIYLPAAILVAALVVRLRPEWGGWRVGLTTVLGIIVLALGLMAVLVSLGSTL